MSSGPTRRFSKLATAVGRACVRAGAARPVCRRRAGARPRASARNGHSAVRARGGARRRSCAHAARRHRHRRTSGRCETVESGAVLFTISSEPVGDRTAERAALGASLSGGQTRLANERQKYESQRHADEQEIGRLQRRLAALGSQAVLKERQVEIAREIAARLQRGHEEGLISWIEASKPRLEAERLAVELEASARRGRRHAGGDRAAALRDGLTRRRVQRDRAQRAGGARTHASAKGHARWRDVA